jgi:hypothetical protein
MTYNHITEIPTVVEFPTGLPFERPTDGSTAIDGTKRVAPNVTGAEEAVVIVEGPATCAEFALHYLQAAMHFDHALEAYFIEHPDFRQTIGRLEVIACVHFSSSATEFVSRWLSNYGIFLVEMTDEWAEMFVVMVGSGFFKYTNGRYQMVVPTTLDCDILAATLLRLAETEDSEYYLHPEDLISFKTRTWTVGMERRLRSMDLTPRVAERDALLASVMHNCS